MTDTKTNPICEMLPALCATSGHDLEVRPLEDGSAPVQTATAAGFQYDTGPIHAGAGYGTESAYLGASASIVDYRSSILNSDYLFGKIGLFKNNGSFYGAGAGWQVATDADLIGAQAACAIVSGGEIIGAQAAGIVLSHDNITGAQAALVIESAEDITGAQAGLAVISKHGSLNGAQLGLFLYSEERTSGLQLGVVTAEEGFYKLFGLIPIYDDGSFRSRVESEIAGALNVAEAQMHFPQ